MRRLVHEHAAALAGPRPAPRVRRVVRGVPPAEDVDGRQGGPADAPLVDRGLHAHDRRVEPALADDAEPDAGRLARGDRPVAVGERGRERLLDDDVGAVLGRGLDRAGVRGVRRADRDGLDAGLAHHRRDVGERLDAVAGRERVGARLRPIAHRDQVRGREDGERVGVRRPDLAAPDERRPQSHPAIIAQARPAERRREMTKLHACG